MRRKLVTASIPVVLFLLITPLLTYSYFARDIASADRLMNRNNTGLVLLDREGRPFYTLGRTSFDNDVALDEIADTAKQALLASEDRSFYEHPGFSIRGMAGALYANVLSKDPTRYGGSTITQQLVKNKLLTSDKTFLRKYQELSMAIAIERHYSKDDILKMYLNSVYFGEGAFGIGPAAKTYFNKSPSELTLAESSMLVAVLPAPSRYSPVSGDPEEAKKQQTRVLEQMVEAGYITDEQKTQALAGGLNLATSEATDNKTAPHFALMVLDELQQRYGEERVARSGFQVTTGLDLDWQKQAEKHVRARVAALSSQGGTNAALVAIDPKSGAVRALVGSADWDNQEFGKVNMALAPRQPGSSFKPIYFTEAMDKRLITPATVLQDKQKTYGGTYTPQNYDFRFRGDISVRDALGQSLNIPAVDVMQKLGVEEAAEAAQRMGISTVTEPDKYGLSLALGTAETRLLEMTNAYAAFANGGSQFDPVLITGIKDKYDRSIYSNRSKPEKVMSPEASFLISSILSDTQTRAPLYGTSLNVNGWDVAVKTGTTNDNKDAWTIGYTPNLSVGVWLGNNANRPMTGIAGGSGAGPVWKHAMQSFLPETPGDKFVKPAGVVQVRVCTAGDKERDEYFMAGTEPRDSCRDKRRREEEKRKKEEVEELREAEEEAREAAREAEEDMRRELEEAEEDMRQDAGGRGGSETQPDEEPPAEEEPAADETPTQNPDGAGDQSQPQTQGEEGTP